jgi:hypothetical protein
MHIDSSSYGEAKVGVAVGNSVCGSYKYQGSFQPLGHQSRDMGLFKGCSLDLQLFFVYSNYAGLDDDGTAYLLTEDVRIPAMKEKRLLTKVNSVKMASESINSHPTILT